MIEALCTCDNKRLVSAKGDDIPKDAFVRHWKSLGLDRKQGDEKAESSNGQGADESIAVETGDWTDKKKKVTSSIKSRKTKRKRKTERNARVQATTSNDDLRHSDTVQQRLAKGLDQLEDELQEKKQTKKSERRKK